MMMKKRYCVSFHYENDLAVCPANGTLHLWDVTTGMKRAEFTPLNHLKSLFPFTCLSWNIRQTIAAKQKQSERTSAKRAKAAFTDPDDDIVALGTETGEVLLYDTKVGELLAKLGGEHVDKVNCICWTPNSQSLLSCSEDQHIVHWDVSSYKAICKWRGDKRGVSSIVVGPHNTLLSAGKTIKLWDLESKTLLRKFNGHMSPILSLLIAGSPFAPTKEDASPLEKVEGLYFLSAASENRVVNIWQVRKKHKKAAVASFSLNSEPVSMSVRLPKTKEESVTLMVLTEAGELNIFSNVLNGAVKKPLCAQMTISIVDSSAKKIEIISAVFCDDSISNMWTILIAYGSALKVAFERINLDDHATANVVLHRQDPMKLDLSIQENGSMTLESVQNSDEFKFTASGAPDHGQSMTLTSERGERKNKRRKIEAKAGQQIHAASEGDDEEMQPPRADSISLLIAQGLRSDDKEVLSRVLQNTDPLLIHNTIASLPLSLVSLLIQDLTARMKAYPAAALKSLRWLRETLKVHSSYLMKFSEDPVLSQLYQTMEARSKTQKSILKLEGKLELVTAQIEAKKVATAENKSKAPICVYEDESSDEQEDVLLDDLPEDHSDSDGTSMNEWEELEVDAKDDLIIDEDETDSGVSHEMED